MNPGDVVTIRNGNFYAVGEYIGPGKDGKLRVRAIKNDFDVSPEYVELGKHMDWSAIDRETTTQEDGQALLASMGEQFEELRAERDALAEVVAMQCEVIGGLQSGPGRPLPAGGQVKPKVVDDSTEWFEGLVDRLELYLLRQLGTRKPLSIADVDLRNLVAHILD